MLRQELKLTEKAKSDMKFQSEREHHAGKLGDTWKKISIFVCVPVILLTAVYAYKNESNHLGHFHKSETEHEYLFIRKKPFPFGDGKGSFFHHDTYNHIKEGFN